MNRYWPGLTVLAVGIAAAAAYTLPAGPARLVAAVPILVVGTGLLLLTALTGPHDPASGQLPGARLGLATMIGVTLLPAVALVLHAAHTPISRYPILAALLVVTVTSGAIAQHRIMSATTGFRHAEDAATDRPGLTGRSTIIATGVVLAVTAIGGGAVLAYSRLPHPPQPGYTSLALGGWAAQVSGPVSAPTGGVDVPVDIDRRDHTSRTYRLSVDGQGTEPLTVVLPANGRRTVTVRMAAPPDGCLHRSVIRLSPADAPGPVLTAVLYVRGNGQC